MNLGKLIAELEKLPADLIVTDGFGKPMSYRGYYEQCAFEPEPRARIGDMLHHAKSAMGRTFKGYKSGEYTFHAYTDCWVSPYGKSDDNPITMDKIKLWAAQVDKTSFDTYLDLGNQLGLEKDMNAALKLLKLARSGLCDASHHCKQDRHSLADPCPIEQRASKLLAKYGFAIPADDIDIVGTPHDGTRY